jgi:1L-myo-inositol 1-phosphate cytidylyltransferase
LIQLLGRPLISYTLEALAEAGIETVYAVIGFEGGALRAGLAPWVPAKIDIHWIDNPEWQLQNGVSALAAAPHVSAPFLLTMGDHLFDPAIVDLLLRESQPDRLNVAIDRKLDSIFDLEDAMKVQMDGARVIALGKDLRHYNAIDTGLFVCPPLIFGYLDKAKVNGDCSLADGVRAMAEQGLVRGIDIGAAWWQDIDTPQMLARAQEHFTSRQPAVVSERATGR